VVAVVVGAASWLLRDQLFRSGDGWFPLLAGVVTLGSAVMGLVRGVLTARREFGAVAACLVLENLVRCGVALGLYAADVRAPAAYGVALLAGYAVVVAWPAAFRLSREGARGDASAVALIGGAAGGQLIGQAVLTGGPVVLALAGGTSAEVTALFAGLALFRAPYTLALGVVSPVTGRLTRLVVENRVEQLRRFARSVVGLTVVGAAGAAVVGYVVGPVLLELVFGSDVALSPGRCLVLAVGSTVAMASLVLSLGVLAHGRSLTLVRAWLVALVPGVAWFALAGGELLDRTCVAFLVVEVAAFLQLPRAGLPRG
jgi:O-antigen/teichoic acid export membrane protein